MHVAVWANQMISEK